MNVFAIILLAWLGLSLILSPVLAGSTPSPYTWGRVGMMMLVRASWIALLVLAVTV